MKTRLTRIRSALREARDSHYTLAANQKAENELTLNRAIAELSVLITELNLLEEEKDAELNDMFEEFNKNFNPIL